MPRALLGLVLLFAVGARAAAQELPVQLDAALSLVSDALEKQFARSLPLPAPAAGVSYSFDPATGNFQRDASTFGQVYLERAQPLGAGRFNVSFVYQYVQLDALDGIDADNLRNQTPIPFPDLAAAVDFPKLDVGAEVSQFLFAATYGISEALEASLAIPLVYSDVSADVRYEAAAVTPQDELVLLSDRVRYSEQDFGIGDVMLRGKYRFAELTDVGLAAALLLRFPSGDEEELQGIGFFEITPSLVASTRRWEPASWARLQGYFNGGIAFDTEDVDNSEARWGFGLDWGVTDDLTASLAFLAQNEFARVAPAGTFTVPRCNADLVTCAIDPSVRVGTQQLFGLTGDRPDYYDLAIGGRGALWRDTLFAFVNVSIPLNDGFVRTEPVPLIGFEGTF